MNKPALPRGIRLRGTKFMVDITVNGKRKTATCETLELALETRARLLADMEAGKVTNDTRSNAAPWTLQQALDKTLSLPKPEGWRGISYEKQATLCAQDAISFFGPDKRLQDITREHVDLWFADCEARGNSDSTINRKRSALSKLSKVAAAYGGLKEPLKLPKQRKEPVGRIRQISEREEENLLMYLDRVGSHDMVDAVKVLIDTGMRRGELLHLQPSDVDHRNGVVMVYGVEGRGTKNGRVRSVPMTKRVKAILRERDTGNRCFSLAEREMRTYWDNARAHMGLTEDANFTLHVCRHTCASRLVRAGVSLAVVQKWLGHERIETTMRYSHLYPQDLMAAVKALET